MTVPQELEIIRGLESGEGQRGIMGLYSIRSSAVCDIKKWKEQL
jgi:hypothetical protein